jgi:rhamnulokinase
VGKTGHIAVDLGAESGRVVVGVVEAGALWMVEVHRFQHRPLPTPAGLCWDFTGLWNQILTGLRAAAKAADDNGITPVSVGVDTWGVDWSLVTRSDTLVGLPRCYRDPAFGEAFDRAVAQIDRAEIYGATGIQVMQINTLYQLVEQQRRDPARFGNTRLLFMPDLFHWMLSGVQSNEETIASTSQIFDPHSREWAKGLLEKLALPTGMLENTVAPGTVIGRIRAELSAATGLTDRVKVIAPPSHDTAAAVAAIPASCGSNWAFLSSGTWSLLGAELSEPCINEESRRANFTNELGIGGTVRFLKSMSGLWLVQECRRQWEREGKLLDYAELTRLASEASPLRTFIPVEHPKLHAPEKMIDAIQALARESGQPCPQTPGQIVRCCLESLALQYGRTLQVLERLLKRRFDMLHVVGGGTKNTLLTQMTASAIGRRVLAGPDEATVMGNLLTQAIGCGILTSISDVRVVTRTTCQLATYEPLEPTIWRDAAVRYAQICAE